ncbi:hypothetical protein M1437_02600 [Patescibacteria group bacterium]|nr:hypothetical protein [Patescibacteria group bacterium]
MIEAKAGYDRFSTEELRQMVDDLWNTVYNRARIEVETGRKAKDDAMQNVAYLQIASILAVREGNLVKASRLNQAVTDITTGKYYG